MQISRENLAIAAKIDWRYPAPKGWTFLGAGSSRAAYLAPDGLVYKVCKYKDDTFQSRCEVKAVWRWRKRDLPEWCIIPRAYFDAEHAIVVMEHFEGSQPRCHSYSCVCEQSECWYLKLRQIASMGWADCQTANAVLTSDGKIVIVDLGCDGS